MNLTAIQIPAPKDWQAFERLCADLWELIWNDPDTQMNGRGGQEQHGVDVYGRINGTGPYHGVQCKGKNGNYGKGVTEKELRREVEKAKDFRPKIEHFILATTAPNDQNIQAVARKITIEHEKVGLFPVVVYAWDEIQRKLAAKPEVIERHLPGLLNPPAWPTADIESPTDRTHDIPNETVELIKKTFPQLAASVPQEATANDEKELNDKIDHILPLLKKEPKTALALFEDLLAASKNASPPARFRLTANIGSAHLELNELDSASEHFINAGNLIPEEVRGLSRIALGYLIQGKLPEAIDYAQRAISLDPKHDLGYAALIGAISESEGVENIEDLIPKDMQGNPNVSFNLGQAYLRNGEPTKAVEWSAKALEADSESRECKLAYGEALLAQAYSDLRDNSGEIPPAIKANLETARDHMESVWEEVLNSEQAKRFATSATNLAHIHQLLKNTRRADEIVQRVLQLFPRQVGARKLAAELCIRRDSPAEALEHLSYIPTGTEPQADFMRAETLAELGELAEALDLLNEIDKQFDREYSRLTTRVLRIQIIEDLEGLAAALRLADAELDKDPHNISILIEKSKILKKSGDEDRAKKTLIAAAESTTKETLPHQILRLADAMRRLHMYDAATLEYGKIVQFTADTPALRDYLTCLYYAEQRQTLNHALKKLPAQVANIDFYKKAIAYHYLQAGDLHNARKFFEDLLANNGDTLPVRLAWIQVLQRQMDEDTLSAYCSTSPDYPEASPAEIMQLVHIIMRYGDPNHALKVAYRVSRLNPRDLDALKGYCSLSISGTFPDEAFKTPFRIEPDVSFTIKDNNEQTLNYTIEANWPYQPTDDQILSNHRIARAAIGKAVGEAFTLHKTVQDSTWTVFQIENKHTRWYRRASQMIQQYFPVESGFELINVAGKGDEEFDFTPIFKSLDQRREAAEKMIEAYKTKPVPIALFASLLSTKSLDAWIELRRQVPIICCEGTEQERKAALSIIDKKNKYIVDPLTLYSLFALEIHGEILEALGDVAIVQSSLDIFTARITELKGKTKQGTMVSGGDGTYIWNENDEEQNAAQLKFYSSILEWAHINCEIIPALGDAPSIEGWKKIADNVESWFFDTMMAAKNFNRILLAEDQRFRLYAKHLYDVDGIWIQMALWKAVEEKTITLEKYSLTLGDLILGNHTLVSTSSFDLVHMLEHSAWDQSERFTASIKSLQKESLDIRSVIMVTAHFIQYLWSTGNMHKEQFSCIMLHTITETRQGMSKFILRCMVRLADFIPTHRQQNYMNTLESWGIGHMLFGQGEFESFLHTE